MTAMKLGLAGTGVLLVALASGCDQGAAPAAGASSQPAGDKSVPAAAAPTGETKVATAPAGKVELEETKNDKLGYAIKIPKGAETQMADENGGMYTHDTMVIKVEPSGVALATVDDVLRGVNTGEGKVDKKTEGDLLMAIVTGDAMPVNVYAGPKGAKIQAHCMAEPSQKELAIEICSSVKSTK